MDPLSVTASLLAVLGAANTAAKALERLMDLYHASDQLLALVNEVADLQAVLKTASEVVQIRVETFQDCGSLAQIVQRANQSITELNHLIDHELSRKETVEKPQIKQKASHKGFLRHHRKVRSLKVEIREIKLGLQIAMGSLTFSDVSRLKLHISNIDVIKLSNYNHSETQKEIKQAREVSDASTQCSFAQAEETLCNLQSSGTVSVLTNLDKLPEWKDDPPRASAAHMTASPRLSRLDELVSSCPQRSYNDSHIRVEASILPIQQCDRFCLCRCHRVTNLATSNSLGRIVGRLFIGYVGVPFLSYRTCSRITCRHGRLQMKIRIAYLFPLWFALRLIALTITKASTTFMWTLSFPAITETSCSMLVLSSLGSIKKIQVLLSANSAALNAIDIIASKSALHVAIQFRQSALVTFLIQQGADMFLQDCNSKTPLDTYYENYFTSTTEENRMTSLLPIFEKYDFCDHWNLSQIHLIVLGCSSIDLSTYLSVTSEKIDVVDSLGRTALMWAAWRGDDASFSTLLQFGANPHASSFDGNSVLIYATYGGSKECLRLVLGAGADINHMSRSLVTPVMVRPRLGDNMAIATLRVVRGASIEASRQQRFTPLYVAALTNQVENLAYLLDAGATTDVSSWDCSTPITVAISLNNHGVIEELIRRDSDLYAVSDFKISRLASVAMFGDERTMRIFMDARLAIDITLQDTQGRTAQDYLWERLHSTGPMNSEKESLARVFRQLVDACSEAYDQAEADKKRRLQENDEDIEDPSDVFQDALEDVSSSD